MAKEKAEPVPHSWAVSEWDERAPHVFPSSKSKADYLIRSHMDELLREGALVRVGRERVMIRQPYSRWLAKQAARVVNYEHPGIEAMNARRQAATSA